MEKIKKAWADYAKSDMMFLAIFSVMMACFITGAIIHSLSWGATAGLFTMSAGLLLGMLLWTFFFSDIQEG